MKTRLIVPFIVLTVAAWVLGATAFAVTGPAAQSGASQSGLKGLPAPASGYTLTYDGFNSGTCSTTGFSVAATGHFNFQTDVTILGHTTLNGSPYDTFSFGEPAGVLDFSTGFSRGFSPAQPTATWTFVFYSDIMAPGLKGTSVTTINCTNGTLSASNAFSNAGNVPTLGTWGIIVSILILLAAGLIVLRARHTALG